MINVYYNIIPIMEYVKKSIVMEIVILVLENQKIHALVAIQVINWIHLQINVKNKLKKNKMIIVQLDGYK